jgi:CelD/BcsL family acetyltransferase involved in cellulose biosynthesis
MLEVREINDIAELAELRDVWHGLLQKTSGATFFSTVEWLQAYWRHHAARQKLRTLVVADGSEVIGILPLVVRREPRRVGALRTLTYPLDYWGSFYGPIGPNKQAVLAAGLRHVRRTRRDWDVIDLRFVDETEADRGATPAAMIEAGLSCYRQVRERVPLVRLPDSFETYLAGRRPKLRHYLRQWQRKAKCSGDFVYERHIPQMGEPDPRWDLYDICEEVAQRSWQGSSTSGTTLSHDSIRPFLRDVHLAATRVGATDVNLIRYRGRPVAFAYNYVFNGYVFGLRMGFDSQSAPGGIGNLMYANIIRDSISRGFHTYDLGPGSLAGKQRYQTEMKDVVQYSHYAPAAPRAQLLRLKHVFRFFADWAVGGPRLPQAAGSP